MATTGSISALLLPAPPVLHTAASTGAASELDGLRQLALSSLEELFDRCDRCIVVCKGPLAQFGAAAAGDLRRFGVNNANTRLPSGWEIDEGVFAELPLLAELSPPAFIFSWLLERIRRDATRRLSLSLIQVPDESAAKELALRFCSRPAALPPGGLGLIVLGELSARRGSKEYASLKPTPEAQVFDEAFARTWRAGDQDLLRQLLCLREDELVVSAGAPMHFLLEVLKIRKAPWNGEVVEQTSPYGVTYLLARMGTEPGRHGSGASGEG